MLQKNWKNNAAAVFYVCAFFLFPLFCYHSFAQTTAPTIEEQNKKIVDAFPYKIDFSQADLKYLRSLDDATFKKLIIIAKLVNDKNVAVQTAAQIAATANTNTDQITYSPTFSQKTPYFNNQTGQFQSKDPQTQGGQSQQQNPYLQNNSQNQQNNNQQNPYRRPENNPYQDTVFEKYYPQGYNSKTGQLDGGFDSSLEKLSQEDMKDLPKLGTGGESCGNNFGVVGNMNGTQNRLRFDTNRLCVAFGKKIKVVDAKRDGECAAGAKQHECGKAMDFEVRGYGDRKQQALLLIALISLGYNIGSYTTDFPLHADFEDAGKWKTWSGVPHTKYQGSDARNYDQAVYDALQLIGMPADSAASFRSTYGNPTVGHMVNKAKMYLESIYGADAGQFKPATS